MATYMPRRGWLPLTSALRALMVAVEVAATDLLRGATVVEAPTHWSRRQGLQWRWRSLTWFGKATMAALATDLKRDCLGEVEMLAVGGLATDQSRDS